MAGVPHNRRYIKCLVNAYRLSDGERAWGLDLFDFGSKLDVLADTRVGVLVISGSPARSAVCLDPDTGQPRSDPHPLSPAIPRTARRFVLRNPAGSVDLENCKNSKSPDSTQ